jgi:antitoxin CptB
MATPEQIAKLRWACRRGMLELDLFLKTYLEQGYPHSSPEEQAQFEQLLECPDPVLFSWLMGRETPDLSDLAAIVAKVKRHAKNV